MHLRFFLAATALLLPIILCAQSGSTQPAAPQSEEAWVVGSVATDILRLAAFATHQTPPAPDSITVAKQTSDEVPTYRITTPEGATDIAIKTNPLDPALYLPLANKLLGDTKPDDADYESSTARALAAFNVETFLSENKRISEFLTQHPASPDAHADAALLLGAFALRENSGVFWNPLPACIRATAHATIVRTLEPDVAPLAESTAELAVGLIIDTKADCQLRIEALAKAAQPDYEPWIAAARYRNTRDWRPEAGPTLLEKVERYRALCEAADTSLGIDFLRRNKPESVTDWGRIMMEVSHSVGDGHIFTESMLGAEMAESAAWLGKSAPENNMQLGSFLLELNAPATPAVQNGKDGALIIDVLDRGLVAAYAQRHLCHAIFSVWHFLAEEWGVDQEAAAYWSQMEGLFSRLDLFPIVTLLKRGPLQPLQPYTTRLDQLFENRPEIVPDSAWILAASADYRSLFPGINTRIAAWFNPPLLTGTAYKYPSRANALPNFSRLGAPQLESIYQIAPLQAAVVQNYLDATSPNTDEAALQNIAGPLLDYYVPVIVFAANHCTQDENLKIKLLSRAAEISPDWAITLARMYRDKGQDEKAAEAFQLYADKATDRVSVSNQIGWLVNYYYDHGQKDKAVELAQMAAEVYSYRGLDTYASLLERMGDYDEAETYYARIRERYESVFPLYQFLKRRASDDPAAAQRAVKIESEYFPHGMQDAALADFSRPPEAGVEITENSIVLKNNGLHAGAIIVAVEGKKVENEAQYTFVRDNGETPAFTLIVYQDGKYQEIRARAKDRRFGVGLSDWKR